MNETGVTMNEYQGDLLLGTDPGWKNCGYALLEAVGQSTFKVVSAGVHNPSKTGDMYPSVFAAWLHGFAQPERGKLKHVTIERYVSYKGVNTAEAENILMTIGGLKQALLPWARDNPMPMQAKLHMLRAFEWKASLVKLLVKHTGFDNPSTSLDKKFSIAAAKHITGNTYEFKTDHEADAVCLAAYPAIVEAFAS